MRVFATLLLMALPLAGPVGAQTIEKIKETQTITFGFRTDASPLSLANEEGNPAGYSPLVCRDLAREIAGDLGIENLTVEFVPVDTSDRFEKVANGEIDLLCGAATITLSRLEQVDFSLPTYVDGASVMVPVGAAANLLDLKGRKVGFRSATTTEQAVENSFAKAGVEIEKFRFNDHEAGIAALMAGEIDAYFADQSILLSFFINERLENKFAIPDDVLTIEKHGFALRRGDADFRLLVDKGLSRLYASGRMQQAFATAMPGAKPGVGLQAMYLIAPTLP
ncbi:MAG: amino acid ABC transporter substrate-binding protein [Pseudomonadota bacterium]